MRKGALCLAGCLATLAIGCGSKSGPDDTGYLVLDQQARLAGYGFEVDGLLETGVMPIEVTPDDEITLVGDDTEEPVEMAPGDVLLVHGADGAWSRLALGRTAAPDLIDVDGPDLAVQELAEALGGEAERAGAVWRIWAPDGFREAALMIPPSGLVQVLPVDADYSAAPPIEDWELSTPTVDRGSEPSTMALGPAGIPGLANPFGESVSCEGVSGVWRGQQYMEHQSGWYRFTLNVDRGGRDGTELFGHIISHGWRGDRLASAPPQLGEEVWSHYKVRMPASGEADSEGVRFTGLDWSLEARLSGWAPTFSGEYCEDSFSGKIGRDGLLRAENDDGCNPIADVVFTRVACNDR